MWCWGMPLLARVTGVLWWSAGRGRWSLILVSNSDAPSSLHRLLHLRLTDAWCQPYPASGKQGKLSNTLISPSREIISCIHWSHERAATFRRPNKRCCKTVSKMRGEKKNQSWICILSLESAWRRWKGAWSWSEGRRRAKSIV